VREKSNRGFCPRNFAKMREGGKSFTEANKGNGDLMLRKTVVAGFTPASLQEV
jgi:hypothetical protein